MIQEITESTRKQIRKSYMLNFRLHSHTLRFQALDKIFNNKKHSVEPPILEFLKDRSLIDEYNHITPLGITVVLSHKLDINIKSVFVLAELYHHQSVGNETLVIPVPLLLRHFEFQNIGHIKRQINYLKEKQILDNLEAHQLRISIECFNIFKKNYHSYFLQIKEYLDTTNQHISTIVENDLLVVKNREKRMRLVIDASRN